MPNLAMMTSETIALSQVSALFRIPVQIWLGTQARYDSYHDGDVAGKCPMEHSRVIAQAVERVCSM
jgi:hypothetical protein